jgi:glycosyltransferase involved in cell wall biosynthesis
MMLGLAPMIAQKCGPPVVCSLSGEDIFLEKLKPPHYEEARTLLRERARCVHAFVALNNYFADFMADYLKIQRSQIHVIPHGLNLVGHGSRQVRASNTPLRVGYLARICHDKGLHLLVEACELLAQRPEMPQFELQAAGYLGASDRKYLDDLRRQVSQGPFANRFHYAGELDRPQKIAFLQSLDVFSTPTVYRESKGLPALEAMANGVPVLLPRHGSFPEIVAATGGGSLFTPHDVAHLADELARLLLDRDLRNELGKSGREAVHSKFHAGAMAEQTMRLYERLRVSTSHISSGC